MEVEVRPADEFEVRCAAPGPRARGCLAAAMALIGADMEAPVLGQQQLEAVHDRRREGHSISAIARELELDRKTVRSCLLQAAWRPYRRAAASSLVDRHRDWLATRAPEVDYSARILWHDHVATGEALPSAKLLPWGSSASAGSLGLKATAAGYRVLFTTAATLIEKLTKANIEGQARGQAQALHRAAAADRR